MKRNITKFLAALTLLVFTMPSLVAWGQTRTEVVAYTLDGTITGSGNTYADYHEITQNDVTWQVKGNVTTNPWRIGGKNLSEVDRDLYSKNSFSDNITKVVVTNGTATATVHSMSLIVADNEDFADPVSTISGTWVASSTTTFERPTGADWTDKYFKIVYNVTCGSSNQYAQFVKAEFYKESGTTLLDSDLTLVNAPVALTFDLYNNVSAQTISYTTSSTGSITISPASPTNYFSYVHDENAKTITVTPIAVTPSAQTVTISQAANNTYNAGEATFTVSIANSTPTYTVTYKANGGTDDDIVDTYFQGDDVTVRSNTFIYTGHAFTKWNTAANGTGTDYQPADIIEGIQANVELYAQWEESSNVTHAYNFAGANNFYTDAALTTHPSSGSGNNVGTIYYGDGSTFVASGTSRYFSSASSGYFMLGKSGAQISLPTFEGYKITQVIVHTSGSVSTNVEVSIVSGNNTASAAQKWATNSDFTYDIAADYQTSALSLKVTNAYNSQFTSIQLVCEVDVPSTDPYITASDVNITYNATSGSIAYSIENEPTPAGDLTASTTANWLTLGTATSEAVPFTCTANDNVVSRLATVTLTYTYDNDVTVTKDIIVTQGVDATLGTSTNPYTVAQARTAIDAFGTVSDVYATGTVSQIVEAFNSQYGNITYNISADGQTNSEQLQAYRGKSYNGDDFTSADDIQVGDSVVIHGNLKKYSGTYEFDSGNQLVYLERPTFDVEAPTFSLAAGTYAEAQSVTISCATTGATIYYTTDGTTPNNESTAYTEALAVSATTTFKAIAYVGEDFSMVTTITYHINSASSPYTVAQALAFHEYPTAQAIWVHGIVSTAPTQTPTTDGQLTYYISDNGAASNQLEVYKGKGLNGAAFESQSDIQLGDVVTITGIVKDYNGTIEFDNGNYLVSFERPTYSLTVNGYAEGSTGGYKLIASPVTVYISEVQGLAEGTYDLYAYDDAAELEWINYKQTDGMHPFTTLEPGKGYLYAKKATTETPSYSFTLTGAPYAGNGQVPVVVGWNLIGNPFGNEATLNAPFYRMNEGGAELSAEIESGSAVNAMEGVFVNATEAGNVTFSTASNKSAFVAMNVTRNRGASIDRAIVRFDEGQQLPKFQLNPNNTKIYVTEGNQDFAIVRSANEGEMPVSFKASENGTYTLAVETENMEMDYLHLIDNMTGMDVDLLQTPNYTFEASTRDYASRFRLVFKGNSANEQTAETFAFFNGTSWTVSNQGEATLQVVDVMGRLVSSETINGNATLNLNETPGIYMLRLVNGNDVKVQKVVVR